MGNTTSGELPENVIPPEMLISKMIGHTADDDYYARSTLVLQEFQISDPTNGRFNAEDAIDLEEAYKMVTEPGMEHGYVRKKDGTWYIACHTDLGSEINGEMIDWWFRNCDSTEKYRWWHPKNHISGIWEPQFYSVMPNERKPGHCVDHTHILEQRINGVQRSILVEYTRPSKYFDVSKFEENGITACLVGRIYIKDPSLGMITAGHLVHMVREQDGLSELRSRYWLGDFTYPETVENFVFARVVNFIAHSTVFRYMKLPASSIRNFWIHCAEEAACLKEFLPHYYTAMHSKANREVQRLDLNTLH